jgi:hypothetical protein
MFIHIPLGQNLMFNELFDLILHGLLVNDSKNGILDGMAKTPQVMEFMIRV